MDIFQKTELFVRKLLTDKLPANRVFHNLEHTESVVIGAEVLCAELKVTNSEREMVLLAAWFHDTGSSSRFDFFII